MKRKIVLIILVFLFNIVWVNAITEVNNFLDSYDLVIKTNSKPGLSNNPLMEDLDVMLNNDLEFEGENAVKIGQKIDNFLKGKMTGKGEVISKYAINSNINPYLVAGMIIEESECDSECSFLVKKCNNVAKLKYDATDLSQESCLGGYYQKFNSLDDSIKSYIKYVKTNFYDKELTTVAGIANNYKKNVRWVFRVNQKIDKMKKSVPLEK